MSKPLFISRVLVYLQDFLLYIWEIRTQIFAYDVDHIYGFYSSEYNVQLGLKVSNNFQVIVFRL